MSFAGTAMIHITLNMVHGNFPRMMAKQAEEKCVVFTDFTNRYNAKIYSILYRAGVSTLQMANTHLFLFPWQEHLKKNNPL